MKSYWPIIFILILPCCIAKDKNSKADKAAPQESLQKSSPPIIQPDITFNLKLKTDETAIVFPVYGILKGNELSVRAHAWIFEREKDSIVNKSLLKLFRKSLELENLGGDNALIDQRASYFLVDNERGKELRVTTANSVLGKGESQTNGHVEVSFKLPIDTRNRQIIPKISSTSEIVRDISPAIQIVSEQGYSVISDIDDTIKVSDVTDKKALLQNTFAKPFAPVAGMASLYQELANKKLAVFHYVSASPWQLILPISKFLEAHLFPSGSLHMKNFRWKDSSFFGLFQNQKEYKMSSIEKIITDFPLRKFILFGDSGEEDPEIFSEIIKKYTSQIERVYVHALKDIPVGDSRFSTAFSGVDRSKWQIYKSASDISIP